MIKVELIYDADCPAAGAARENLRQALCGVNLPPRWTEWERSSSSTPQTMRAFGSPAILVNGRDVAGGEAPGAASCRIYQPHAGRLAAVPPVELIASAISEAIVRENAALNSQAPVRRWMGVMAIPAALASVVPAVGCPLCWPAYAALLSSAGLGFLASSRYLFFLTAGLLAVAMTGLGIEARRRGYAPLALGIVASAALVLGKLVIASAEITYAGVILLLAASLLSLVRVRTNLPVACATAGMRSR
jgi:hypothetical protein